jgi:uncharacterized protein (DUF2267 family)
MMAELAVLDTTIQKTHEWLKDIADGLGFRNQRSAFAALRATLHTLRDRLPLANAAQLGAQLPILIRGVYYEGWNPTREPSRFRHKQEFLISSARSSRSTPSCGTRHGLRKSFSASSKSI